MNSASELRILRPHEFQRYYVRIVVALSLGDCHKVPSWFGRVGTLPSLKVDPTSPVESLSKNNIIMRKWESTFEARRVEVVPRSYPGKAPTIGIPDRDLQGP